VAGIRTSVAAPDGCSMERRLMMTITAAAIRKRWFSKSSPRTTPDCSSGSEQHRDQDAATRCDEYRRHQHTQGQHADPIRSEC